MEFKKALKPSFFVGVPFCVFQQDLNEEKSVVYVHSCVEAQHLVLAAGQHSPPAVF